MIINQSTCKITSMNTVNKNIVLLMSSKNMSQSDLARLLGVSPQTVQQWSKGKTSPRGGRLDDVAKALGVSTSVLMDSDLEEKLKDGTPLAETGKDSSQSTKKEEGYPSLIASQSFQCELSHDMHEISYEELPVNIEAMLAGSDEETQKLILEILNAEASHSLTKQISSSLRELVRSLTGRQQIQGSDLETDGGDLFNG